MQRSKFFTPSFEPQPYGPCFCGSDEMFKDCCGSTEDDRPPPQGVLIQHDYLDPETCATWVEAVKHQPGEPLGTWRDQKIRVNKARVTERVMMGPVEKAVTRLMRKVFSTTIQEAMGREIQWFERPQILRYQPGNYYWLHADSEIYVKERRGWKKNIDRDVSLLIYLNNDFTGGELEFYAFNYFFSPMAGDLVFFPSDHRYAHRAHPVKTGQRYVIVSWAAFRDEPKVFRKPTRGSNFL